MHLLHEGPHVAPLNALKVWITISGAFPPDGFGRARDGCDCHMHSNVNIGCVLQEVALIGLLAYLSYLCGDWLGLSGIVALFCCAVTISHYALHNVSSLSRVTTVSAFQTLSYVSEGAIFIYVGMDTLDPLKWQVAVLLCSLI